MISSGGKGLVNAACQSESLQEEEELDYESHCFPLQTLIITTKRPANIRNTAGVIKRLC